MSRVDHGLIGITCLAILLIPGSAAAADAPEILVEAGADEIFIGESVDYVVELRNVKDPAPPDMAALQPDFQVVSKGDESRNQSTTLIINGKVSQQSSFGHMYRFRLTPKRTGSLTIPAPSVTIDGKAISGRALPLKVIAPEEQDVVVPEISTDRDKVYPTQPFEVTLRVLVRPLPNDSNRDPLSPLRRSPPHLDANWVDLPSGLAGDEKARWLEKLLAENGVGFTLNDITMRTGSLFDGPRAAILNLYRGRESRMGLDGEKVNYFVYELKRRLVPEKAGKYVFGPAVVKGTFVEKSDGRSYTGRRLVAVAPVRSLEVRDVPTPRPVTYCGGIGKYAVSASASPQQLRVGDPLTLTLDIERSPTSGSLELISAPDLAANPGIAHDFEIVDKSPTGRSEGETKRFAYGLRPKRAGVSIPGLSVTVFNPDTENFEELVTKPVALTVSEASRVTPGELVGALSNSGKSELKSSAQGIFQNITDVSELRDQNVNVVALAEIAVGLWCGFGCLFVAVHSYRRRSSDAVWQRRQNAPRKADRLVTEARSALAESRPTDALRAVRSSIVGLIADMQNIVAEGLTASETDAVLSRTAVPAEERAEAMRLLEAVESAEYGSGSASEIPALIAAAERLLPKLARHLERGS